ncbi:hypothetical protein [Spiroplasma sabaudiense]|nr:hypothetical protein [Spiroplasma sabaudiense]
MVKINKTIDSIMEPMELLNKMVEDHYDEKGKLTSKIKLQTSFLLL